MLFFTFFGCIIIAYWGTSLNICFTLSLSFLFGIINLCLVTMKTNTSKFYVLLTMQRHLLAWYKIKKAYYKTFYTDMRVPEYVRELFFYKLYLQNKVSNHARTRYSFFSYVNIDKAVYFCIYLKRLKKLGKISKSLKVLWPRLQIKATLWK